jgi:hypothetical protein
MTPDLFDASVINTENGGTILIQLLRGIGENGLLADLNKSKWSTHISKRMQDLSPPVKDRVQACLKVIADRHRLVRHPKASSGDPMNDQAWLNVAFESHKQIPFHAILLSQELLGACGHDTDRLVEFFSSLDSEQWEHTRNRTLNLAQTESAYRNALSPVLRYAKVLKLIDPFFSPGKRDSVNTLALCYELLGQRRGCPRGGRIEIHADATKLNLYGDKIGSYFDLWKEKLTPYLDSNLHQVHVFLWSSSDGPESMHDRFILTDQCGISCPGGLNCKSHPHANSTDWSLLDEKVRELRWSEYDSSSSRLKLIAKTEL